MGAARVTVSRGEARPTALVAEDHPLVAQILRRVLEEAGFAVRVESEVDETVTAAQDEHPALLLLDVQLAGGARFAALEQIAALALEPRPGIIVISGDDGPQVRSRAEALGADLFLPKPCDLGLLADAAQRLAA
jgi:DNA-binding NarL/FixJ family response regulator